MWTTLKTIASEKDKRNVLLEALGEGCSFTIAALCAQVNPKDFEELLRRTRDADPELSKVQFKLGVDCLYAAAFAHKTLSKSILYKVEAEGAVTAMNVAERMLGKRESELYPAGGARTLEELYNNTEEEGDSDA